MKTQKIALFGASSETGMLVAEKALDRGHLVTAVVHNKNKFNLKSDHLKVKEGDPFYREDVYKNAVDNDIVICAEELLSSMPNYYISVLRSVIEGVKRAGVKHLIIIGYPYKIKHINSLDFQSIWRPLAYAQNEAIKLLEHEKDLDWCYVHSSEISSESKTNRLKYSDNEVVFISSKGLEGKFKADNYIDAILDKIEIEAGINSKKKSTMAFRMHG